MDNKLSHVPWTVEDERNAVLDMLRAMHPDANPDAIDGYHALDVLEVIIRRVERKQHLKLDDVKDADPK